VILSNIDNYVIIFDEVQHLKSQAGTSLYPAAQKLSVKGRYCWGLSATPQMNGRLEELHAIIEVIRPGTFGSLEGFRNRYCEYVLTTIPIGGGRIRKVMKLDPSQPYKNVPELMKIVRPFFLKRASEVINKALPKVVTKEVMLEMLPDQARLYQEIIDKRFLSPHTGRRINSLAALTYAQLVSDTPENMGVRAESSKMVELLRILNEEVGDEKIIIYAKFRRTIDQICIRLHAGGFPHVRITGAEKTKQRDDAKLVFNNPSSGVNLICINRAGGTSLDLQQASVVIFYDLPWSWGEWDQVLGRARRIGSPHLKVLAIILTNQGTVDQHALNILRGKEAQQILGVDQRTLEIHPEFIEKLYEAVRKGS
jgi:non-specific serine/threonine protein kinase